MKNLKKHSLLIAENDELTRKNYSELLREYFNTVYEAKDGEEAWEVYYKRRPSILLIDINMPKIDGLTLSKMIREKDDTTKIIILSAYSEKEKLLRAIELNLVKYLIKPIILKDLEDALFKISKQLEPKNLIKLPDGYIYDTERKELIHEGDIIKLTKSEIKLLDLLTSQKDKIFSNDDIFNFVWENSFDRKYNVTSIKVLIKNMRGKLPDNTIENTYGLGYRIKTAS